MTFHCAVGEIARITFSGGDILEFPGPIEITCNDPEPGKCFRISYSVVQRQKGTNNFITTNGTLSAARRAPFSDSLVNGTYLIYHKCGQLLIANESQFYIPVSGSFSVQEVAPPCGLDCAPYAGIKIKDINGSILYQDSTTICNSYSVSCIAGCPSGTLDCGDCCLSCDTVFNEISSIRALVRSLK